MAENKLKIVVVATVVVAIAWFVMGGGLDNITGNAAADKVNICHFPPGNVDNPQFITVGARAADAHFILHDGDFVSKGIDCVSIVPTLCGDNICTPPETALTCPIDCAPRECPINDGTCADRLCPIGQEVNCENGVSDCVFCDIIECIRPQVRTCYTSPGCEGFTTLGCLQQSCPEGQFFAGPDCIVTLP